MIVLDEYILYVILLSYSCSTIQLQAGIISINCLYIFTLSPSLVLEHQEIFAWSEFKFLHLHFLLLEIACHALFATIPLPYGSKLCLVVWLQHIMQMMWIPNLFLKYFSKMLVLLFFWRYLYSFLFPFFVFFNFFSKKKKWYSIFCKFS